MKMRSHYIKNSVLSPKTKNEKHFDKENEHTWDEVKGNSGFYFWMTKHSTKKVKESKKTLAFFPTRQVLWKFQMLVLFSSIFAFWK